MPAPDTSICQISTSPTVENPAEIEAIKRENLVHYREAVEKYLSLKSPEPISNGQPEHAAIIFETFFKNAKERIRIFCHKLNADVFGQPDMERAVQIAIARRIPIEIIVQRAPDESAFLNALKAANISIIIADNEAKDLEANFAIMDDEAIRIEQDNGLINAVAYMHRPKLAKKWGQIFDQIKASLAPTPQAA